MYYALIDWDNTIRSHYTIYELANYMQKEGFVPRLLLQNFKELEMLYLNKELSYANYTISTCESFAQTLTGYSVAEYNRLIDSYIACDELSIFKDSHELFRILAHYGIEAYIVSGAPFDVLKHYTQRFQIKGIFAFELETQNGLFTGKVTCNFGIDKQRILDHPLFQSPHSVNIISMGDSVADIPLLNNSCIPITVGKKALKVRSRSASMVFSDKAWDLQSLEKRIVEWRDQIQSMS